MPATARSFEPHITRSGGVPSKYRFTVQCSACPTTDGYEVNQRASDQAVKGYFSSRGWLLGRDRSYDLCPACLAKPQGAEPRKVSSAASRNGAGPTAQRPSGGTAPMNARHKDTADILARHMGRPEALAAEVFRPQKTQAPIPASPDVGGPPVSPPALSPAVEQALIGMAADLTGLRSTMGALVEQVARLVDIGGQQIDAIARLSPLVIRAADGVSRSLKEIATAVCAMPGSQIVTTEQLSSGDETIETKDEAGAQPVPGDVQVASQPSRRTRSPRKDKSPVRRKAPGAISVKSIADPKRPDRFYTAIRLPRELWDSAGFDGDDRLQIDWTGKVLSIIRAAKGGVKPKTIGTASVVLQSWRLGELNFDQATFSGGDGSLRLTVRPEASRGLKASRRRGVSIEPPDSQARRKVNRVGIPGG